MSKFKKYNEWKNKKRVLHSCNVADRERLYSDLCSIIKRKKSLSSYEKFHVLRLVSHKISEGKL